MGVQTERTPSFLPLALSYPKAPNSITDIRLSKAFFSLLYETFIHTSHHSGKRQNLV